MSSTARLVRFRRPARLARAGSRILYPLDHAYRTTGLEPPAATVVDAEALPEPYRRLLVHDSDMTQTLERHVGDRLLIRPLSMTLRGRWYFRRVLLVQSSSGRPVEMGAIRISVDVLPARVRAEILRGEVPLGRILREAGLDYKSRPQRFVAITPNSEMMGVFWMREPQTLYGRQTVVTLNGAKIGQVVEVLPLV